MLRQKQQAPLLFLASDLAKPSLYLRLSPACPVLALAAGSCCLPTLRNREAQNTGYALACAAAHSLARALATAAGGVARERAHICAEAISAGLHSNAVSGPSTRERGFLPRSRAWTCPRWTGTGASLSYGSPVVCCAALPSKTAAQIFETRTKQHIFPSFLCLQILQRWSFFLSFAVFQNTVRWEASTR